MFKFEVWKRRRRLGIILQEEAIREAHHLFLGLYNGEGYCRLKMRHRCTKQETKHDFGV